MKENESKKDETARVKPNSENHIKEKITVPLENEAGKNNTTIKTAEKNEEQGAVDNVSPILKTKKTPATLITVKRGDTLTKLAIDQYGRVDGEILDMIKQQNPNLNNVDLISIGQEILFPALSIKSGEAYYTVQIGSYKDFKNAQEQFQRLIQNGNEAFILPIADEEQAFRVTLGRFQSRPEAELFALSLLIKNVSKEVEVIKINLN
jgi:LysM repeat protein